MIRRLFVNLACAAVLCTAACQDDPPPQSGNLARPSGLAYIPRGADRADLVIADSEAQGVRVLQLTPGATDFVNSPSVFFPLAIPAPGFPTELAVSKGLDPLNPVTGDNDRVYALSAATSQLHVLDVKDAPFMSGAVAASTYFTIGSLEIDGLVPELALPVDVGTLPSRGNGDLVVVALEVAGADFGYLAALRILIEGGNLSIAEVQTTTIAARPSELEVRDTDPASIVIASAGTSSISVVRVGTGAQLLGNVQLLDVGGPTRQVIDARDAGLVALRFDAPIAVLVDTSTMSFSRSSRQIASVYAPADGTAEPGAVYLRPSPPVTGAYAQVETFPSATGTGELLDMDDVGGAPAVMIAHADALQSFLIGSPLELAVTQEDTDVVHNDQLRVGGQEVTVRVDGTVCSSSRIEATTCPARESRAATEQQDLTRDGIRVANLCPMSIVATSVPQAEAFEVEFRGNLRVGMNATLTATMSAGNVAAQLDVGVTEFDGEFLRVGDRVHLVFTPPEDCAMADIDVTGVVATKMDDGVMATFEGNDANRIMPLIECSAPIDRVAYEIYPAGDDVIIRDVLNDQRILGRTASMDGRATFTPTTAAPRFNFTMSATMFSCGQVGRACRSDADCRVGTCPGATGGVCPSACAEDLVRLCDGVRLETRPPQLNVIDPGVTGSARVAAFAPDDVVYAPLRSSWFTSLPGARALGETIVSTSVGVLVIR